MRVSVASHVGLVRERNEDDFCVWRPPGRPELALLAVADGMGGHRAGEVASALALATLRSHLERELAGEGAGDLGALLAEGILAANRQVYERARRHPELRGMGTTVTAVLLAGLDLFLGHVGDSRAYLVRGDGIVRLTSDHSVVGQMVDRGHLTETEALSHPQRHVLTRALGVERGTEVDTGRERLRPGDVLVLATDGLTSLVSPEEIAGEVRGSGDFLSLACRLVRLANERGGHDNVTVVLAEV